MPIYSVQTRGGRIVKVEAPEGTTQDQLFEFVASNYADFDEKEGQHLAATGAGTFNNPYGADTSTYGGDKSLDDIWDSAPVGAYVRRANGEIERKDATLVENLVGSAARGWNRLKDVPEALGEFVDAGVARGREMLEEAGGAITNLTGGGPTGPARAFAPTAPAATEEARQRVREADVAQAAGAARRGRQQAEYDESISNLKPESVRALDRARTTGEALDAIKAHPIDTIGSIGVESGVQFLPAIAASFLPGGAALASVSAGGMSAATELASGLESFVADNGINPKDEAAVRAFLLEGDNLEKAREYALTRAGIIGAIDATTGGVGKLATIGKGVVKSAAVREAANIAGQTGIEMGLGAGGEALAQGVTKGFDNISGKDVLLEAAGELVQTPGEVAGYARERYRDATRPAAPITGTDSGAIGVLPVPGSKPPSGPGTATKPRMTVDEYNRRLAEQREQQRAADVAAGTLSEGAASVGSALDAARVERGASVDAAERVQELQRKAEAARTAEAETPAVEAPAASTRQSDATTSVEQRIEQATRAALDATAAQSMSPPVAPVGSPVAAPATAPATLTAAPVAEQIQPTTQQALGVVQRGSEPAAMQRGTVVDNKDGSFTVLTMSGSTTVSGENAQQQAQTIAESVRVDAARQADQAALKFDTPQQAAPTTASLAAGATSPSAAAPQPSQSQPAGMTATEQTQPADIPRMKLADTAEQQRDSRRVASALSTYSDTPIDASQVRIVKLEDPKQQRMADRVGRILGRRIVFYDAPSNAADAFARDSNTIYISANAINKGRYGVRALIGHEFVHTLRMGSHELFAELAAFATPLINRAHPQAQQTERLYRDAYGKKSSDPARLDAAVDEELIADRIGDLLNDENFWADLANENPSLFQRMIRKIISYLDGVLMKAQRLQADDVFNEAKAMREKALDILRRHADQVAREGAGAQVDGQARMKIGAPEGDVTVDGKSMFDEMNSAEEGSVEYHVARALLYFDGDIDAAVDGVERYARAEGVVDPYILSELKAELEDMQANAPEIAGGVESADYDEIADLFKRRVKHDEPKPVAVDAKTAIQNMKDALGLMKPGMTKSEIERARAAIGARIKQMENATGPTREDLAQMRELAAAGYFEMGDYVLASRAGQLAASASGAFAPETVPMRNDEMRKFMEGANSASMKGGKPRLQLHGTAANPTVFRGKQAGATFVSGDQNFVAPYPGMSMGYIKTNGSTQITVGGEPLSRIINDDRKIETPEWHAANLLSMHGGSVERALGDVDILENYPDAIVTEEEIAEVTKYLEDVRDRAAEDPSYLTVEELPENQIGMSIMPLIANTKKTWDFDSYKDIDKAMALLREKHSSPQKLSSAMDGNARRWFDTWRDVSDALASGDWTVIEDHGIGLPELLKNAGYDSFHVREEGVKNLAVFDPRQLKSAYGNVGTYGQRLPTAEEAASLGMTLEEAIAEQEAGDIRLRLNIQGMQSSLASMFARVKSNGGEYWQTFHRWMIDEFADLKRIQDALGASVFGSAANLPSNLNAWRKENLRHGAYQDQRKAALAKFVEPMTRLLAKNGHTLDDFGNYLWWRHASERDAYLRRNLGQGVTAAPDALAGIDPAVAQQNIAALDPSTRKTFEHAARFIDALRKDTLDRLLSSGQITADRHANLMNQYEFWVPLRGLPGGDVDPITGRARGLSMSSNAIGPRATGRKSKPSAIIENMVADMEQSMVNAHKQGVLASIVRLVVANPDPNLWEIAPVKAERKWVDGVLQVVQTNGEPKDQLTFMHQGVPVAIEIRHEQLKTALLNLNSDNVPDMLRKIGRVTRWLSAVKTSLSPFFMLVNPLRDAGLASMAIMAEHDMATLNNFRKFYASSYAALNMDDRAGGAAAMRAARKKGWNAHKMKTLQYAREFASFGGKTGYTYVNDIRAQQKSLESLMVRNANTPGMRDLVAGNHKTKNAALLGKKLWQNTANLFELANDLAENATRLAVFSAMREKGMSAEQAAEYAKEVTVNFNRRGAVSKHLNSLFMFFNAAAQGSARLVRLSKNPKFAGMMGGLFALSYTSALAQMIGAGDDDDGESKFDKAVAMDAQRSLPIYVGNGNTLNLPVPYGPNMMTYAGYRMAKMTYDLMRGKTEATEGVAGDIAAQMVSSMSPIDPGKGWTALMPEVVRIPAQAITNKNDFGGRISPKLDDRDQTGKAHYTETDVKTAAPFLWVAMALNKATGGDAYEGGAVNMTGEQARYIWDQFTGGLGRLASESYELIGNKLAGVDPEPSDVPLFNVYFRGKGPEGQTANAYYSKVDKFNKATRMWEQAVEADDQEMMARLLEKAPWLPGSELSASSTEGREAQAGTIHEVDRQVRRALKSLRQQKDALYTDDTISAAERRRRVKELDLLIAEQQSAFVGTYNQAQQR